MQDTAPKAKQRMVRKQFLITAEQNRRLKAAAASARLAEAQLVRAGIDRELASLETEPDWRKRLRSVAGSIKDASHLEATVKAIRKRSGQRIDEVRRRLAGEE